LPPEKRADLCLAQESVDDRLTGGVDAVNPNPALGNIANDRGNMHSGRLLSVAAFTDSPPYSTSMPGSGRHPPHWNLNQSMAGPKPDHCRCYALSQIPK
jgi:hypothetical protein